MESFDAFSLSDSTPRKGRWLTSLALTGWSNKVDSHSDNRRLYWKVSGSTVTFYKAAAMASGDAICSGTIASGVAPLTQSNTSGITGSVQVRAALDDDLASDDVTGTAILSFASEADVELASLGATALATSNPSPFPGTRMEGLFASSRRMLENWVKTAYQNDLRLKPYEGRYNLSVIAEPRQLSMVQAYLVAQTIALQAASRDANYAEIAKNALKSAQAEFAALRLEFVEPTGMMRERDPFLVRRVQYG